MTQQDIDFLWAMLPFGLLLCAGWLYILYAMSTFYYVPKDDDE